MLQHKGALNPFDHLLVPALEKEKVNMGKSDIREHYVSHFCLKNIRSSFSALLVGQLAAAAAGLYVNRYPCLRGSVSCHWEQ